MVVVLGHCHSGKLLSAAFITVMLSDLFVSDAFHFGSNSNPVDNP